MKKKAMPPMAMTAGQCGRILFNFTLPEGTAMPELVGALMVHGQRVDMVREAEDRLLIPVCPPGVYLAEVRAAGVCVLYGHVEVLPSPLYEQDGVVCYTIDVDAKTDVLAVSLSMVEGIPGPRGAQGIQGERGLQGASAYDLAVAAGYKGSEAEWVAELQGAQAAANAARASESAAAESARAAREDKAAAVQARDAALAAQTTAEEQAAIATKAAEDAQAPESIAAQAARPATMLLVRDELMSILGDASLFDIDTDGQKIIVHTDRLSDDKLAAVNDMLERFVPGFIELVQYNHHIEISWRDINKYAECVTVADFVAVNPDFIEDLTSDGAWVYPMTSFPGEDGNPLFRDPIVSQMTCFVGELPNLEIGINMFMGLKSLTKFDCDLPIIQNAWGMFGSSGLLFFRSAKNNLKNCGAMFRNTPMTSFDADLSKLVNGDEMFAYSKIAEWHVELPNLQNARSMFIGTPLTEWHVELPKLQYADNMFNGTPLTEWHVELPNLQGAPTMFHGSSIQVFNAAMPKLSNATQMFKNAKSFTTWRGAVPSLTNANAMFEGTAITYFDGELPQVTTAEWAFLFAPLVSFNSNLPKLDSGDGMFHSCQLNKESVLKICNSIPSYTSGTHKLSLGIHIDHQQDEEVLAAIANAEAKGWTLTVQWNGTPTNTASTFGFGQLIYAKVNEIEQPDGTTERMLNWGHYVTDDTGYETFRSLESAYEYYQLPAEEGGEE